MSTTTTTTVSKSSTKSSSGPDLAYQYGGNYARGWVTYLPQSWLPYIQLTRLNPPAGLMLVYFPHLFGVLLSSILLQHSLNTLATNILFTLSGSFFLSNALHIWDDIIDAPLDKLVSRTKYRPIPRGAVTPFQALIFTITQTIGAAAFLPYLPFSLKKNILYALPGAVGWTYYPFAKRHTNLPQVVLGACMSWGVVMGAVSSGLEPFHLSISETGTKSGLFGYDFSYTYHPAFAALFAASSLWTMIYDTIYAHQDLKDDLEVGIKSLAVLFQNRTKGLLWTLLVLKIAFLVTVGQAAGLGKVYYAGTVGGSGAALGLMILKVNLKDTESCWWWFGNGFWFAGGSIVAGLVGEWVESVGF